MRYFPATERIRDAASLLLLALVAAGCGGAGRFAAWSPAVEASNEPTPTGRNGGWELSIYGLAAFGLSGQRGGLAVVAGGRRLVGRLDLLPEFSVYYIHQSGPDAVGALADVLLRWRFLEPRGGRWALYLDGGAGVTLADLSVPAVGTRFNFMEEAGLGLLVRLAPRRRLFFGGRFLHLSNAGLGTGRNQGLEVVAAYGGLSFGF